MCCEKKVSHRGSDALEMLEVARLFDHSATAWLLGQAVRYLNSADKEGELAYTRVVEVLRRPGDDLLSSMDGLFRQVRSGDTALRWNLLYVLGDAGDPKAIDFLVRAALKPLPEPQPGAGCETERDMEMLVNTMAVHAIYMVARRHPETAESLLKVISARPARPVLVEAVKLASELGFKERARELLPKEEHWILDIRRARIEELYADSERKDTKERGFTPPKSGSLYTAPSAGCCTRKEN